MKSWNQETRKGHQLEVLDLDLDQVSFDTIKTLFSLTQTTRAAKTERRLWLGRTHLLSNNQHGTEEAQLQVRTGCLQFSQLKSETGIMVEEAEPDLKPRLRLGSFGPLNQNQTSQRGQLDLLGLGTRTSQYQQQQFATRTTSQLLCHH